MFFFFVKFNQILDTIWQFVTCENEREKERETCHYLRVKMYQNHWPHGYIS